MTASALGRVVMRTVCVASNVSSIICFWWRRPLAIGDALAGSHDGQRDWSRGNANGLRRIECEFDPLFLAETPLAIGGALARSHDGQRDWSRGNAQGDRLACARKKLEPTHIRLLRRSTVCVASNVSSITCFWWRRPLAIGDVLAGSHDGQRRWSRGNAQGRSVGLRAEEVRADSRQAATGKYGLRSIECEFDHLFLVETALGHRRRACRIA
jgi:hypothetical protein